MEYGMRISIILTVLNEAASLPRLLDSLAGQSRQPDELVVCDGGSRDGTLAILEGERRLTVRLLQAPASEVPPLPVAATPPVPADAPPPPRLEPHPATEAVPVAPSEPAAAPPAAEAPAERLVGSICRECLDHLIVLNETLLRRILSKYLTYYHDDRTRLTLEPNAPIPRSIEQRNSGPVVSLPRVGGLHHRYSRVA